MIDRGYMTTKVKESNDESIMYTQTYVTAKGVSYIRNKLIEFGDIKLKAGRL